MYVDLRESEQDFLHVSKKIKNEVGEVTKCKKLKFMQVLMVICSA